MKNFSKNGNYSISDYRAALERKKKIGSGSEYADEFIALINESYSNRTSSYQGLIRSILRECVELETFVDGDGNEKLRVAKIEIPEDLVEFFPESSQERQRI